MNYQNIFILCCILIGILSVKPSVGVSKNVNPIPEENGFFSVKGYGAKGDGCTDDTLAFQKALNAAGKDGGTVLVPSVGAGKGYVITHTLRVPSGVVLLGSAAGFATNATATFSIPDKNVIGAKIFARPGRDQYEGKKKAPLFLLEYGCTVRGLFILYDKQPWPTDEEFKDSKSPYYYKSFDEAKARFIKEHVKPCGPTFYVPYAVNVVIEDICCDRYYDFIFMRNCGKSYVNRIFCYGYKRTLVYWEGLDIARISHVHNVPNAGPVAPGKAGEGKTYTWIYSIIGSQEDNIGLQIGRADGYSIDDIFFFAVHTALQFGASKDYPIYDPVKDVNAYYDTESNKLIGFSCPPYQGNGPWGEISGFKVDECAIGIHFVWPSHLTNRVSNALIFTGFDDGQDFPAVAGTGDIKNVGKQGAFVVEPSFCMANNLGFVPTFMCSNSIIASFNASGLLGPASANAMDANGRVFLFNGDITMDFTGFQIDFPCILDRMCAKGPKANRALAKIRGFIQDGNPSSDVQVDGESVKPLN